MTAGLLGIEELSRAEIDAILARAKDFQPLQSQSLKKLDTLRGKMIVNLFYEASTRTRTSFEIAAKRMGADAVSITASGSSVSKGESLVDTLNTLAAMKPDAIVMHPGPINRGVEIDSTVVDGNQSVILPQVTFGIAVRMAVMSMLGSP